MHTKVILPPDHGVADAFDKSYTRLDAMQVDIEAFLFLLPKDAKYTICTGESLIIDWNQSDKTLTELANALASLLHSTVTRMGTASFILMVCANDWSIFIRRLEPLSV